MNSTDPIPRNALSTAKSQRGFFTGYDKNGQQVSFYNSFGHVPVRPAARLLPLLPARQRLLWKTPGRVEDWSARK